MNKSYNRVVFLIIILLAFLAGCSTVTQESTDSVQVTDYTRDTLGTQSDDQFYNNLSSSSGYNQYDVLDMPDRKLDKRYNLNIVINDRVEKYLKYYTTTSRDRFNKWLERSGQYKDIVEPMLIKAGIPREIFYLAMIESGYNNRAVSRARAVGMWQFIYSTGKKFGLKSNVWLDERRDFIKATQGAIKYLSTLYEMFGDWELAIASYNCGEGRVQRTIKRSGSRNYWDLKLPKETMNYIPKFYAAVILAENPEKYGFHPNYMPVIEYRTYTVSGCYDLKTIARCANTTEKKIKWLNPELKRGYTPPKAKSYEVRIPTESYYTFAEKIKTAKKSSQPDLITHTIRRGETIGVLARQYGTTVNAIMEANNISNPRRIRSGRKLLIPIDVASYNRRTVNKKQEKAEITNAKDGIYYKMRRGDTIDMLARQYNMTSTEIMKANGIKNPRYIKAGQKIFIPNAKNTTVSEKTTTNTKSNGQGTYYTMRRGDTVDMLARKYGTTSTAIMKANGIRNPRYIKAGQKLFIPSSGNTTAEVDTFTKDKSSEGIYYTVKKGDTLYSLATQFKTSVKDIQKLNKMGRSTRLYPGKSLLIKSY